jgi:hypothetical protein
MGSNKVKLPKVGSDAIVPVPCGGTAQQIEVFYEQKGNSMRGMIENE